MTAEPGDPVASRAASPWTRFWSIAGPVVAAAGIVVSVWFYFAAKKERQLTYYVAPERMRIVSASDPRMGDLGVTYRGEPVREKDITGVFVAVWNAGKESIRKGDVLKPVVLRLGQHASILDVQLLRAPARDITGFARPACATGSRTATLGWDILERGDGGLLQVIFCGPPDASVTIAGAVEGQRRIRAFELPRAGRAESSGSGAGSAKVVGIAGATIAAISLVGLLVGPIHRRRGHPTASGALPDPGFCGGLLAGLLAVAFWLWQMWHASFIPAQLLPK